jgi:hypothetical protein
MAVCGIRQLGLGGETTLTAKDKNALHHYAVGSFIDATLEALLDHALLCHVGTSGGAGGGDGDIVMATQAVAAASTQEQAAAPFGNEDPAIEAARRLFVLGSAVRELLLNAKMKPIPKPLTPWLRFDLSLPACLRVLLALQLEHQRGDSALPSQARGSATTSKRFSRHILKAIAARTSFLGSAAEGGSAESRAHLHAASSSTCDPVEGAQKVLTSLLALIPHAEEIEGKEAASGRRGASVNPLTGKVDRSTQPPVEKSKAGGGKSKKGVEAAAKPEKTKSRLLLLLEAAAACVDLISSRGAPGQLASALAVAPDAMEDANEDGSADANALTQRMLPLVDRMLNDESYVEADAALRIASRLASRLGSVARSHALSWSSSASCIGNDRVASHITAKALLAFHLSLSRGALAAAGAPLHAVCHRVLAALGDNMNEETDTVPEAEVFSLISEGAAHALTPTVVDAITKEIVDLERCFTIIRRCGANKSNGGAVVTSLETSLVRHESRVLDALRVLCKAQLDSTPAQPVVARCTRLFRHVTAIFKWLAVAPASSYAGHKQLIAQLCGEDSLSTAMYGLISYVGTCDTSTKSAARAKRDAKLFPELVFVVDKFENAVVTLSAKKKDDSLLTLMKKATARDFRIQVSEVSSKLKQMDAEQRKQEAKKRGREESKARGKEKASGGGKRTKKVTNEPTDAGVDADMHEDEDDEGDEDYGEDDDGYEGYGEEADEYPASMIGDDD